MVLHLLNLTTKVIHSIQAVEEGAILLQVATKEAVAHLQMYNQWDQAVQHMARIHLRQEEHLVVDNQFLMEMIVMDTQILKVTEVNHILQTKKFLKRDP